MMRPEAMARENPPDSNPPPARRGPSRGLGGARRHIEARFAPLGPSRADTDGHAKPTARPRPPAGAPALPPTSMTLLIRAAGLVVVVAAVLLTLRPVAKIVRTAPPAAEPARIRVISSTGDTAAVERARPKREARLPHAAVAKPPAPTIVTQPARHPAAAPKEEPLAFAAPPAPPKNPALIATVRAVPVFAPDRTGAPTPATPPAVPQPRPPALAAAAPAPKTGADAAAGPAGGAATKGAALVREARRLLAKGQLGEGRDLLKKAAAAGDGHAATILAKTYDPAVLKVWHVKGAAVDPAEARRWYEKAKELGSPEAKAALDGMKPN